MEEDEKNENKDEIDKKKDIPDIPDLFGMVGDLLGSMMGEGADLPSYEQT